MWTPEKLKEREKRTYTLTKVTLNNPKNLGKITLYIVFMVFNLLGIYISNYSICFTCGSFGGGSRVLCPETVTRSRWVRRTGLRSRREGRVPWCRVGSTLRGCHSGPRTLSPLNSRDLSFRSQCRRSRWRRAPESKEKTFHFLTWRGRVRS